jgi:hypothetical protein
LQQNTFDITTTSQIYNLQGNKPAILQQVRQRVRYYNNNNPSNIIASNKPDITIKYQSQPRSRAYFSAIYLSRPMTKYQYQPTKVSNIIENHRLRFEEPKSTQTLGYNYITTTTRQQVSKATSQQCNKQTIQQDKIYK